MDLLDEIKSKTETAYRLYINTKLSSGHYDDPTKADEYDKLQLAKFKAATDFGLSLLPKEDRNKLLDELSNITEKLEKQWEK